jgi:hypothetical protein
LLNRLNQIHFNSFGIVLTLIPRMGGLNRGCNLIFAKPLGFKRP